LQVLRKRKKLEFVWRHYGRELECLLRRHGRIRTESWWWGVCGSQTQTQTESVCCECVCVWVLCDVRWGNKKIWHWQVLWVDGGSEGGGWSTCRVTGFWLFVLAAENPVVLCLSVAIIKIVFLRYLWCEATTYDILHRTAEETQYAASRTCTSLPHTSPSPLNSSSSSPSDASPTSYSFSKITYVTFYFSSRISLSFL